MPVGTLAVDRYRLGEDLRLESRWSGSSPTEAGKPIDSVRWVSKPGYHPYARRDILLELVEVVRFANDVKVAGVDVEPEGNRASEHRVVLGQDLEDPQLGKGSFRLALGGRSRLRLSLPARQFARQSFNHRGGM